MTLHEAAHGSTGNGEDACGPWQLRMTEPFSRDEHGFPAFWINRGTPDRRLVRHCSALEAT